MESGKLLLPGTHHVGTSKQKFSIADRGHKESEVVALLCTQYLDPTPFVSNSEACLFKSNGYQSSSC